ncbi:MAG: hypothetical protein ACRDGO_05115, partial [Actinomycetota bacterium]
MRVAPLALGFVVLLGACDGSRSPMVASPDRSTTDPSSSGEACAAVEVDGATALRFERDGSCVPGD